MSIGESSEHATQRRMPVGGEVLSEGGVHFRVWAPLCQSVEVEAEGKYFALSKEANGYYAGFVSEARPGMRYRYRLNQRDSFPDPASRFQPEGPHGPSEVVDPSAYQWTDQSWTGPALHNNVIYEIHLGTFTSEGTWAGATEQLFQLRETGITVVEVMPIADFTGNFGWGYDGVNWFAPSRLYGTPDDMRRFVDVAHSLGLAIILDVVYNHFGPDGNYIGQFSKDYFTQKHSTDWGAAINYDGQNSAPVREFVQANAAYWISEYHLDGLRLDATQNIYDDSQDHILGAITRSVRKAAGKRKTFVVAENEPQEARLVQPVHDGGFGMDGLWNDDYHHTALVALTGRSEAYYTDYRGKPQELISAIKHGFLFQGQWYKWQKQRRGAPSRNLPKSAYIKYIENHDQIANSARGLRAHQLSSPGLYRALIALTILSPGSPMLFQGQEFSASTPFFFFADIPEWLHDKVREGRKEFMSQWRSLQSEEATRILADPVSIDTFERSKLDHSEREKHADAYRFHCDLIRLRRTDPVLSAPEPEIDGAVLSSKAFLLRFFAPDGGDRLLLVNLGPDLRLFPAPEPLLAPPSGYSWHTLLSTESPEYGGSGALEPDQEETGWFLSAQTTVLLGPRPLAVADSSAKENTRE